MGQCYGKPAKCAHASSTGLSHAQSNTKPHPQFGQRKPRESLNSDLLKSQQSAPVSKNLRVFTLNDLKTATRNFHSQFLIGEGGFGYVYKGIIDENAGKPGASLVVAIKKLKIGSSQGHKEWVTEVIYLGELHHENLVKLIGFCTEAQQKLLVYEFMTKGSLENHLFRRGIQPITWTTRVRIAIDVARGLSFLHSIDANVIYRDLKASNILLDSEYKAKLSDFGLARAGPTGDKTHVSTRVVGTQGYAAPEYIASGRLTPKSDVYSFGVVLLELLSGKPALEDDTDIFSEATLVGWAKPYLGDNKRVLRIMDTRLGGQYSKRGVQSAASLALECLHKDPKLRPTMVDVLSQLEQLQNASRDVPRVPRLQGSSSKSTSR